MYIKMGYLVPSAFSKPFAASLSCGGFEVLSSLKWRRIQESRAEESISSSLEPTQTFCSSFVSSPSTTSTTTSKMLTRRSKFHFSFLFVGRFFSRLSISFKIQVSWEQKWFNISRNCIDSSSSKSQGKHQVVSHSSTSTGRATIFITVKVTQPSVWQLALISGCVWHI